MVQAVVPPRPDTAPKRAPGSRPGTRPAAKRPSTRSLENEIGAALVTLNLPLLAFAPTDALDEGEIVALAATIDDQARRSPRFRKYVERALDVSSGGQLISVLVAIGARRAARHGLLRYIGIPDAGAAMLDAGIGEQLRAMAKVPASQPTNTPAPPVDLDMVRQTFQEAPAVEMPENGKTPGEITPEMMRPGGPASGVPVVD